MLRRAEWLSGSLRVRISGRMPERLLNLCMRRRLPVWEVAWQEQTLFLWLPLARIRELRRLAHQTGCRVRVVERRGGLFAWRRLRRRPLWLGLMTTALVALYVFSQVVWFIEVEGTEQLERDAVLSAAKAAGLQVGVWRGGLDERRIVQTMILAEPRLSWVDLRFHGTKVVIEVAERDLPPEVDPAGPGDVVAKRAGVVETVFVLQGEAAVEPGDTVLPGQTLIRGVIRAPAPFEQVPAPGETPPDVFAMPVRARGQVIARTRYEGYLELPRVEIVRTPGERQVSRTWLETGDRRIRLAGPVNVPFTAYERSVRRWSLPLWFDVDASPVVVRETFREQLLTERRRTTAELKQQLQRELRDRLFQEIDPAARMIDVETAVVLENERAVGMRMTVVVREEIGRFRPAAR